VSEEGFREIQLNGKQLIFLFMAVTVVSVVIFLFGVLVGRGVRDGAGAAEVAGSEVAPDPGLAPVADNAPTLTPSGGAPSPAPAAPPAEELSYAERLLRDTPPEETLKPSGTAQAAPARPQIRTPPAPAPAVQEPVAEKAPPPPAPKERAPAVAATPPQPQAVQPTSVPAPAAEVRASDPSGPGFAVQVAAYRDRRDADILAKQLAAKGYPAFVMDPVKGTSTALFRVRVGKYKTLKDAEAVEARLQTSEQLTNAWIAR
jgi:cell division septation protein DedD